MKNRLMKAFIFAFAFTTIFISCNKDEFTKNENKQESINNKQVLIIDCSVGDQMPEVLQVNNLKSDVTTINSTFTASLTEDYYNCTYSRPDDDEWEKDNTPVYLYRDGVYYKTLFNTSDYEAFQLHDLPHGIFYLKQYVYRYDYLGGGYKIAISNTKDIGHWDISDVDASFRDGNYIHFMKNGYVTKYHNYYKEVVAGYPKLLSSVWNSFPFTSVDAALNFENGYVYFFSGNMYTKYNLSTQNQEDGYPHTIDWGWNVNSIFNSGIDAAVNNGTSYVYFFKDGNYTKYDVVSKTEVLGYPHTISWGWYGDGMYTSDIDAAISLDATYLYMFKGEEYIKYNLSTKTIAASYYPMDIIEGWPELK
jgi:hypothetical protein